MKRIKKICFVTRFGKEAAGTLQARFMAEELKKHKIDSEVIYFNEKSGLLRNLFYSFKRILKTDFDVMHIMKCSPYSGIHSYKAAKLKGKPVVLHMDDYEFAIAKKHKHFFVTPYLIKIFEVVFPRLCDARIAISRFVYNMIKNVPNTYLIPYGIPEERFRGSKSIRSSLGLSERDKVMIYVGSLTEGADLDLVLKSMAHLVKRRRDVKLLVVGGGRGEDFFKNMSRELGIDGYVMFSGRQPFEIVPNFIKSADICLLPMKDTDLDKSRCPSKLSEYVLSGKIVVGGAVGMVKEYLPKESLVPPDDPKAMADKVTEILKSKSLQSKILKGLEKVRKQLTISSNIEKIIEVYESVI